MSNAKQIIKKQEKDATQERDDRCKPIVKGLLLMIANHDCEIACTDPAKIAKSYTPLTEKILQYLVISNAKVDDISYIFRLLLEPIQHVQTFVNESLSKSVQRADDYLWNGACGKPTNDVDMKDLDSILRKEFEKRDK